jgi:hypothetical protein
MFRRERTAARQKLGALSGVIAIVTAVVALNWDRAFPPPPQEAPPAPKVRPILSGRIETNQECTLSPEGTLAMTVKTRMQDAAYCCVAQGQAIRVKALDVLSASVTAERGDTDFRISLETDGGKIIAQRRETLYGSGTENLFSLTLDGREHLDGKPAANIVRFCATATGSGAAQTYAVRNAVITSPAVGK